MILLVPLVLAVVWGLLCGGRLSRLESLVLHRWELAITAFVLQAFVLYGLPPEWGNLPRISLLAFSYLLLAVFVWFNRHLPGVWLLGAGLVANWAVILANGGYMPVTYEALVAADKSHLLPVAESGTLILSSKDILLPAAETRLWLLSDIFVIPPPIPITSVFSVGDVLIAIGLVRFVLLALGVQGWGLRSTTARSM
jgi:hypothetical protein